MSVVAGNVSEPDVTVRCGEPLPGDALLIDDPLIVVEVASSSTPRIAVRTAVTIMSSTHEMGTLVLEPLGLALDIGALVVARD